MGSRNLANWLRKESFFLLWRPRLAVWRPHVPVNTQLSTLSWPHWGPAHKRLSLDPLRHRPCSQLLDGKKMNFPWTFSSNFWLLLKELAAPNHVYPWKAQLLNVDLSAEEWTRLLMLSQIQTSSLESGRIPQETQSPELPKRGSSPPGGNYIS